LSTVALGVSKYRSDLKDPPEPEIVHGSGSLDLARHSGERETIILNHPDRSNHGPNYLCHERRCNPISTRCRQGARGLPVAAVAGPEHMHADSAWTMRKHGRRELGQGLAVEASGPDDARLHSASECISRGLCPGVVPIQHRLGLRVDRRS